MSRCGGGRPLAGIILVTQNGFDSPEAAAMSTFPAEYCHVVAARTEGDDAYVLLDTGPPERPYLYRVNCPSDGWAMVRGCIE